MKALCLLLLLAVCSAVKYEPTWESLDSRPLPSWYDQGKIGIFLTWGPYAVPGYSTEWFWYQWKGPPASQVPSVVKFMKDNYRPDFTYADFAPMFKTEFYNPNEWADLFNASGARYIVLGGKHCDGFCNWKTKYSWNWNAVDTGPKRDLVGEMVTALRNRTSIRFGIYHAYYEWFNPLFLEDQANKYTTHKFIDEKCFPALQEIVNQYKPDIVWSDADWMATSDYFKSKEFLAWLYNESPVKDYVIVNDRWGNDTTCKHGGFFDCHDKFNPRVLFKKKWESCLSMDKYSWGYRKIMRIEDILTTKELLQNLVEIVSCNGNLLINVGPTSSGTIVPIFQERLRQMGDWLKVNGEAIYSSKPWSHQNDTITPGIWYTSQDGPSGKIAYASFSTWPKNNELFLGAPVPTSETKITLLGYTKSTFDFNPGMTGGLTIFIPNIPANEMPCQWVWIFKLEGLQN